MEYVRRLLEQKQPGFAASLEFAVSLAEKSMEKPVDDQLIRLCAASARVACPRMTPRYLSWSWPELRRRKLLHYTPWFGPARTQYQGVLADLASYDGGAPVRRCQREASVCRAFPWGLPACSL